MTAAIRGQIRVALDEFISSTRLSRHIRKEGRKTKQSWLIRLRQNHSRPGIYRHYGETIRNITDTVPRYSKWSWRVSLNTFRYKFWMKPQQIVRLKWSHFHLSELSSYLYYEWSSRERRNVNITRPVAGLDGPDILYQEVSGVCGGKSIIRLWHNTSA